MKRNINLMQNSIDIGTDSLNELQKEYILQALANLGQRIGIKGDGLSYKNFSFLDLLNNENISYNKNEHIGWLKYQKLDNNELIATFGITNIDTGEEKLLSDINTKDINDILYASNEIQFTIPINNIEKYSKNTIISNKDDVITIITVGKILGYEDVDENNGVLLYYKFDIKTNKPIYIAKIGYVSSDSSSNYYYALELTKSKNNEGVYINNEYDLTIKMFDSKLLGIYTSAFNSLFAYSAHNNGEDIGFAFLRTEFLDLNEFTSYNKDLNNNYDSNSPLSVIMNNISNNNYYASNQLKLYINSEANEFLYSDKNELRDTISLYKNEYNFIDIEEALYSFNNDITDFYRNILIYYNDKFFVENRSQFIKRILCKLYETINNECESLSNSDNKKYYKMYIPLNYELSYVCNSNNELNIYWSNDIYVLLTNLNKNYYKNDILHKNNYIIFDYNEIDKVHSYRFEIDYNKKYENIINFVNVRKVYSMPYVDADETWNINGSSTSIRAIGKDAGNPNIIIINSKSKDDDKESYILLNNASNKDLSSTEFIREQFQIDNSLFINITNETIYCYAWVPKITESNKSLFENSIILNICDLDCLESSLIKDYYLGSNILTIWYYTVENDTYKFKLITKNGKAMPLGVTENLESIINATTLLDVNENELLILKAEIEALGQELLSGSNKRWAIIKNKKAKEYDNENYNNDLNAIVEYTDNLKYNISNEKNIITYDQQEPFIKSVSNITRENVTNVLYPNYKVEEIIEDITTEDKVNELISKIETVERTKINIDGNEFTVNKQIYDIVSQVLTRKIVPGVTQVSRKELSIDTDNNYLNEYVFNSNVPTIDFKEIFLRNINTLNKYNILSLDKEGNIYYGYLGSSYKIEDDKSIMHLGTSTKNINIGTDTLIDKEDIDSFKEFDGLSLDFKHIALNATKTLSTSSYPYTIKKIGDEEYKVGKYWLLDKCFTSNNEITVNAQDKIIQILNHPSFNVIEYSGDSLFFIDNEGISQYNKEIYDKGIIEINEVNSRESLSHYLICINSVLNNLFDIDLLEKYAEGKIKLNIGKNKLMVISNNGYTQIPLFCLLINDELIEPIKVNTNSDDTIESKTIWSTDTLDILVSETVTTDEYNELKQNNEISIITKFDKYNINEGVNRYVIWDYKDHNKIFIYPEQETKEVVDFEVLSVNSRCKNTNTFYEITAFTTVPIEIIYQCRLIYSDGTYSTNIKASIINISNKGFDVNDINENDVTLSGKTLNVERTINIENMFVNPYTEYKDLNTKEISVPPVVVNVLYNPIEFIPGKKNNNNFEYILEDITINNENIQAYTLYKDLQYYPMTVEPDGRTYNAWIKLTFDVKYVYNYIIYNKLSEEYKNTNLIFETFAPEYRETVVAQNSSLTEDTILSIGDDIMAWENALTNTTVNIKYPKCDINIGINRFGYYFYMGVNPPDTDNLDLTTCELIPQCDNTRLYPDDPENYMVVSEQDGWRYLVHSLDEYRGYYLYGEYNQINYDTYRLKYQISGFNGLSPYTEEETIYIAIPEGTVLKDGNEEIINIDNQEYGEFQYDYIDNNACPGLIYHIYKYKKTSLGPEVYPTTANNNILYVNKIVSQNVEETTVEFGEEYAVIGDGNKQSLNAYIRCSLNVEYSDGNIYKVTKEIGITYDNIYCNYDAVNDENNFITLTQANVVYIDNDPVYNDNTAHVITMYSQNHNASNIDEDHRLEIVIPDVKVPILEP